MLTEEDAFASEFTTEQWFLQPQENAKPLLNAGLLIDPFSPPQGNNLVILPDLLKIAVNQCINNNVYTLTPPTSSISGISNFMPYAQMFLTYYRNGVTSIPSWTQTLVRTAIVDIANVNQAFDSPFDNLAKQFVADGLSTPGFMLSTAGMLQNYSITPSVVPDLLPSYSTQITVANVDSNVLTAYAGWRWTPPQRKPIGRNKISITQNFYWDLYLTGTQNIRSPKSDFPLVFTPASNPNGNIPVTS